MTIGERLKILRSKTRLTQKEVAHKTGIHHKTLSGYENDVSTPDPATTQVLAKFYNSTTDYLISGDTTIPKGSSNKMNKLNDEFPEGIDVLMRAREELTPEQQKKMIDIMHIFIDSLEKQ